MKNLIIRSLAGAVFVTLIIGSILWSPLAVFVLFFFFNAMAIFEYTRMFSNKGYSFKAFPLIVLGSLIYLIIGAYANHIVFASYMVNIEIFLLIIPIIFTLFIASLYKISEKPFEELGIKVLSLLYISLPFGLFNLVANKSIDEIGSYEPLLLIAFFLFVWSSDTFAYLTGSAFGKHRLFERISPKKSWEGSIGGAVITLIIAWFFGYYSEIFTPITWVIIALFTVVTASFGDLIESLLKRSMNVKDSGNIMPGHGGILDRFDAAIFSIPFYVFLVYLLA